MERFFNTAGPMKCDIHYCLPPLERLDLPEVLRLIDQQKYFVLHAPRQTGKTSCLLALMSYLNQEDRYRCLYINVELAQAAREDTNEAMRAILGVLSEQARYCLKDTFVEQNWFDIFKQHGGHGALHMVLNRWAQASPRPLILLVDEIDALVGDTLITVLRQLRTGYAERPARFPQSVILCGVRDVRDYRIHSDRDKAIITGGSAFNIKAVSLRLGDFSQAETMRLIDQHTAETGQIFEAAAREALWELTRGQPWLVNALAYETCFQLNAGRSRTTPISSEMVLEAKNNLILRRETHLDQLTDKLQEERVQRVVAPMLSGESIARPASEDDIQYVVDLGLIRHATTGPEIANPIYREVIPRDLTFVTQLNFESFYQPAWYVRPDGRLDVERLLSAFQEFFRENSEIWVERFQYKEAGPQLLMQAFLQRIVNSGGRVEREYGLGRRRTDLLVIWKVEEGKMEGGREKVEEQSLPSAIRHPPSVIQKVVIELKVVHKSVEKTIAEGLAQTWEYMDRCGTDEGHLVLFERDSEKTWDEKIFRHAETYHGKTITVWGM